MDKRGRYVAFFAIVWVIYLIVNHDIARRYIDAAHDTLVDLGAVSGRIFGKVLLGTFFALLFGTLCIHYGDNVYQFIKDKALARRRKEEELERSRQARIQQMQAELKARRQAELEAVERWQQEQEATMRQATSINPEEGGDPARDGSMHVQQKWLQKMQEAIDKAPHNANASISNSSSAAALPELGQEEAHGAAERHQQWLERLQASTDTAAAELQAQAQREKQRALDAIDAKLAKMKEGKKAREEGLNKFQTRVAEQDEQDRQAREGVELERRLRDEQDREYMTSLEQDREKQEERERQTTLMQQKEREIAELKALKTTLRNELQEEPETSTAGVISIRVRLPQGSSHTRRFTEVAQVQGVKDWVQSLEEFPLWRPDNWQLVNSYPRVIFDEGLDLATIADGCSSISLFVERL